jgi:adenosylcobinamide kinase/adenosylcobinamide-phosphate guanylyltransferase
MLTLITGGARSGKSAFARSLCQAATSVVYLATANPTDAEMRARIDRHRAERPSHWQTEEHSTGVPAAVARAVRQAEFVLLDCVTIWLSNLLFEWRDIDAIAIERQALAQADALVAASADGQVIAVTNEVGSGLVPDTPVGRVFRDVQGIVNQHLARAASAVYLVTSGIPLRLK